jgi:hypothetical protein
MHRPLLYPGDVFNVSQATHIRWPSAIPDSGSHAQLFLCAVSKYAPFVAAELEAREPPTLSNDVYSIARDLFYYYDMIRHFHATQIHEFPLHATN